jgi:acetyl-CoA C-acetyltransferase
MMAKKYGLSRAELDAYAFQPPARHGRDQGRQVRRRDRADRGHAGGRRDERHDADEGIRWDATLESIGSVKLLAEDGRITAATASQICDGAAGVMIVNERGLKLWASRRWRGSTA